MKKPSSKTYILILLTALMFFYGVLLGGLQYTLADIGAVYGAGYAGMGLLVSTQHIAATLSPVPVGVLADRKGKRGVIALFSLIFGLGCALCGFSHSVIVYGAGIFLTGAGYSVCESLTCAILSDIDPENSARWINLTQGLLSVGAILSPLGARFCIERLGMDWRVVFYACAAGFIPLAVLLWFCRIPAAGPRERREKDSFGAAKLFASKVFALLFVSILLYVGLENGFGYFVDSLFADHLSDSAAGATAISLYWTGMALSRLFFTLRDFGVRRVLIGCFVADVAAFIALITSGLVPLSAAVCFAIGAAYGPCWSMLVAEAAACFPDHSAAATGMMSTGCGLGGILYPVLMGAIAQRFSVRTAFVSLAVTAAVAAVLCGCLPKKQRS